jgi:hypothetical protein
MRTLGQGRQAVFQDFEPAGQNQQNDPKLRSFSLISRFSSKIQLDKKRFVQLQLDKNKPWPAMAEKGRRKKARLASGPHAASTNQDRPETP